jgi:sugar (pentulose or hexulose) kinase
MSSALWQRCICCAVSCPSSSVTKTLQVLADVFGLPVYTLRQANSAGLGAAYIAYWKGEGRYGA